MSLNIHTTAIKSVEDLHHYLKLAMQLEHATIPPYLTALYSIMPGTNSDAVHVLRVVAVEEMLHLTLAANMLNAVGGTPDFTAEHFVPEYPTALPDGETDFEVNIEKFSPRSLATFIQIERPAPPHPEGKVATMRRRAECTPLLMIDKTNPDLHFYSIGEFYKAIGDGFELLHAQIGEALFRGDRARQITPEYYYSGGGKIVPVYELKDALAAIQLISEQGEGHGGAIAGTQDELAHYFRFQQLKLGRYYLESDQPDAPTGPALQVDWDAVYPILTNARFSDYPEHTELHTAAVEFGLFYKHFLAELSKAFQGEPAKLIQAVAMMFRIKQKAIDLIRNPIPGMDGVNAAPIFAYNPAPRPPQGA